MSYLRVSLRAFGTGGGLHSQSVPLGQEKGRKARVMAGEEEMRSCLCLQMTGSSAENLMESTKKVTGAGGGLPGRESKVSVSFYSEQ